jgi:hypothetical protein
MSRDVTPEATADPLLQRYWEANAFDPAHPDPALRSAVLAHARQVAIDRLPATKRARTAANDSAWNWRALGSLAVIGLLGLLVLQFDRGSPEEKEIAFGKSSPTAAPAQELSAPESTPAGSTETGPPKAPRSKATDSATDPRSSKVESAPLPAVTTPPQAPENPAKEQRAAQAEVATQQPGSSPPQTLPPPTFNHQEPPVPAPAAAPASDSPANPPAPNPVATAASGAQVLTQARAPSVPTNAEKPDTVQGLARERSTIAAVPPIATALLTAIAGNDVERVRQRLAAGADPNQRDGADRTPLMAAAQRGNAEIVRLLLAAGADPALRDAQGLNAADLAERAGHTDLLPLFR